MKTINSIEAAKIEAAGKGALTAEGRKVILRTVAGVFCEWNCETEKMARDHLRLFRASLKYAA